MNASVYRWRCACCGEEMTGLPMDIAFEEPVDWNAIDERDRNACYLDEDFCTARYPSGEIVRLIRCILPLRVPCMESEFRFGVWMSVSETSWEAYSEGFGTDAYPVEGCFGYLMHEIPEYPGSHALHADIWFRPGAERPIVELHATEHELVAAQQTGIEPEQIERWATMMHMPEEARETRRRRNGARQVRLSPPPS